MKRTLIVATLLVGFAIVSTKANAYDWTSRASYTAEWQQQSARITDGRRSGMLSKAEARMLRRELAALGELPYNAKTRDMLSKHSKRIAAYKSPG